MSNHTPGPWCAEAFKHNTLIYSAVGGLKFICKMLADGNCASEPEPEEARSNAKLIIAAPEILEALKEVQKLIHSTFGVAGNRAGEVTRWESTPIDEMVRTAIAKAEGKPE